MARRVSIKKNIKNWKRGLKQKAISMNEQKEMRKGLILT